MITLCGCHKEFEIDNEYQNIIDEIKLILIYKYVVFEILVVYDQIMFIAQNDY